MSNNWIFKIHTTSSNSYEFLKIIRNGGQMSEENVVRPR